MKKYIKSVISLTAICAVVAILLSITNYITAPVIEENAAKAAKEAMLQVLPEGKDFAQVDLSSYELPETVTEAYSEAGGGYVVKLTTSGYGSDLVIMCGINAAGEITGATCLSSNETLGEEKDYGETALGSKLDSIDGLATVAGVTKTTAGYKNALKDALNAAVIFSGGSADIKNDDTVADAVGGATASTKENQKESSKAVEAKKGTEGVG